MAGISCRIRTRYHARYRPSLKRWQLAEWLQQGVGRRIDFVKAEMKGNRMAIFQVDDLGVAMAIQKLSGRKFNGKAVRR